MELQLEPLHTQTARTHDPPRGERPTSIRTPATGFQLGPPIVYSEINIVTLPTHEPPTTNPPKVSDLYAEGSSLRERGFAIFYSGINIGALLAPLVCGTIADTVSYHAAFALAGSPL